MKKQFLDAVRHTVKVTLSNCLPKKCTTYGRQSELSDSEYPGYHRLRHQPPNKLYTLPTNTTIISYHGSALYRSDRYR